MRLIITGGGTGGHVFPGVAVAREFMKRNAGNEILFAGAARGVETRILPAEGFAIRTLDVTGLKGKGLMDKALSVARLARSVRDGMKFISDFAPGAVLGVGGYASGPVGLAAAIRGIPLFIAEQNAAPGLTNRWLARFARKVFVTWPGSERRFPAGKGMVTGNPVRPEFFTTGRKRSDGRFLILAIGGSQGARSINRAMMEAVPALNEMKDQVAVVHQTGQTGLDDARKGYEKAQFPWTVEAFFNDMPQRLADADLVISRSGAGAVAEICAAGRGAVYVPFPFAADDHQTKNAEAMAAGGAAMIARDSEINGEFIRRAAGDFIKDGKRLAGMGAMAKAMAKPNAAAAIVDEIIKLAEAA
ncbi:MAG: undecaprenyldiphospho-muramoylpentapeptide beta-N-acetylglucosaminyltransferase [Nitrospinae bacterium]|nr:undecaprenyldiphospho-muramoylpentapeptide beta-N-acetylglucosaminyltransferase [Nitrospinota bacterium]